MGFGRFEVEGQRTERKSWECYADSPQEAVAHFHSQNPGFRGDCVNEVVDPTQGAAPGGWGVIGSCEACGVVLLDGDEYETDPEGVQVCPRCAKSS
jgi:hypothetical protein